MPRLLACLCLAAATGADAAPIDFAGFPVDREGYEAFTRSSPTRCLARADGATCTGEVTIEGLRVPAIVLWRRAKGGERLFGYGTADMPCDIPASRRLTEAWNARWGAARRTALAGGAAMWQWLDALGNRASYSTRPEAGRAACTLLVEGGRWSLE